MRTTDMDDRALQQVRARVNRRVIRSEDMQPPEALHRRRDQRDAIGFAGHVGADEYRKERSGDCDLAAAVDSVGPPSVGSDATR